MVTSGSHGTGIAVILHITHRNGIFMLWESIYSAHSGKRRLVPMVKRGIKLLLYVWTRPMHADYNNVFAAIEGMIIGVRLLHLMRIITKANSDETNVLVIH